jgi:protein-tyrosine phosphatase
MKILPLIFLFPVLSFAQNTPTDTLVYNARRAVTLEGGSNFRDLGGYPAASGKIVKWGHIYRSADISKLTDTDLKTLESRHISVDCDLRGPDEVKNSPDRIPTNVTYLNLPAGSENIRVNTNYAAMNLDSMMSALYERTDYMKAKYKPMFDQLLALNNDKALLFHCAGGRDRTGMGAALVLSALGVDKAIVLKDYVATAVYLKRDQTAQFSQQNGMTSAQMTEMIASPKYLELFFGTIDKKYGSMDKFLAQEMELTPEKRAILQAKYLN